jgi:hypothetical protein
MNAKASDSSDVSNVGGVGEKGEKTGNSSLNLDFENYVGLVKTRLNGLSGINVVYGDGDRTAALKLGIELLFAGQRIYNTVSIGVDGNLFLRGGIVTALRGGALVDGRIATSAAGHKAKH